MPLLSDTYKQSEIPDVQNDLRLEAIIQAYQSINNENETKANKLKNAVIKTIEAGFWHMGDQLPTEMKLTQVLPLSLGTVQKAMQQLVKEGIITRRRGSGSRIMDVKDSGRKGIFLRFFDKKRSMLSVETLTMQTSEVYSQGPWSHLLKESPTFIQVNRKFSIGKEFNVFGQLYLDGGRFRPLLDYSPETFGNFYICDILHDRFNTPLLNTERNMSIIKLPGNIATIIGTQPESMGIALEIYGYTLHNNPLLYQIFYIPENSYWLNMSPSTIIEGQLFI